MYLWLTPVAPLLLLAAVTAATGNFLTFGRKVCVARFMPDYDGVWARRVRFRL